MNAEDVVAPSQILLLVAEKSKLCNPRKKTPGQCSHTSKATQRTEVE